MQNQILEGIKRIPQLTRYLLLGGVVFAVSLLFPKNIQFKFTFEEGEKWRYSDLYAPFDFPIVKSDEEYREEVEGVKSKFSPYYKLDSQVIRKQQEVFMDAFRTSRQEAYESNQFPDVQQNGDKYRDYGLNFLERLYRRGVFELAEVHRDRSPNSFINVLYSSKKIAKRRLIRNMTTKDQVFNYLSDTLISTNLEEPDFLSKLLEKSITSNIFYNDSLTQKYNQDRIKAIPKYRDRVVKDSLIIARNDVITTDKFRKLQSYKEKYEQEITRERDDVIIFVGYLLLTVLIIGLFAIFLRTNYRSIFDSFRQLSFILVWILLYSYLVYWAEKTEFLDVYMIPFAIVPIIVKTFYDSRLALFVHLTIVLIASLLTAEDYTFTFLQIIIGVVVALANFKTRNWSQFFVSILYILLAYCSVYLGLALIQGGSFQAIEWIIGGELGLNVFLTLLAYPLIPLLERIFGFTSEITLVELSALDSPLLKKLSMQAPGTFQHSLQVANLSEAAASAIGANALLVKVAAYYHDIGKMKNAVYYIENQSGQNLHDQLTPLESAKMIISHITDGVKMAKKEGLPKILIDFILSHHGTTRVEYFYRKHLDQNPDAEVDESIFRYPGPKPQTKEQLIMMLADSIEAASKSLKNPDAAAIDKLVEGITAGKMKLGQFDEAPITFSELNTIKATFKKLLKSIYHIRIAYPDGQKP